MNKKRIHFIKIIKTFIVMIIILLFISPFFIMISTSLKEFTEITKWPPTWVPDVLQWENYRDVWSDDSNIKRPFFNSLIVSTTTMVLCTVLGSFAAYGVSRFGLLGKRAS